jgi:hypothetical protein
MLSSMLNCQVHCAGSMVLCLDVCSHDVQRQADQCHQIPQEHPVPMPPLKKPEVLQNCCTRQVGRPEDSQAVLCMSRGPRGHSSKIICGLCQNRGKGGGRSWFQGVYSQRLLSMLSVLLLSPGAIGVFIDISNISWGKSLLCGMRYIIVRAVKRHISARMYPYITVHYGIFHIICG